MKRGGLQRKPGVWFQAIFLLAHLRQTAAGYASLEFREKVEDEEVNVQEEFKAMIKDEVTQGVGGEEIQGLSPGTS